MYHNVAERISDFFVALNLSQYIFISIFIIALYVADRIAVKFLSRLAEQVFKKFSQTIGENLAKHTILKKLAHLAPAIIVNIFIPSFQNLGFSVGVIDIIQKITSIYIIAVLTSVIVAILNAVQSVYKKFKISSKLPIKNYIQIVKIIIICLSVILMISVILGKSPLTWLTSFGAIAAIFSLAFKDSVTDIVAGIEIAVYDVIRVNDWITIPKFSVDGDVIDITLTRVKVQNFDKTISFLPTHEILNSGIKNWRGMSDAGGRRIKRAFNIDFHDIKFLDAKELDYINNNIVDKPDDFADIINKSKELKDSLTNEMLYRKYIHAFLKAHNKIHKGYTLIIRQLEATENGLPIQIYCFTADTNWKNYENIQSDIFSHLFAMLPIFGLKSYQRSSDFKK